LHRRAYESVRVRLAAVVGVFARYPRLERPRPHLENGYDDADRILTIKNAVGTAIEQTTVTNAYTANGKRDWVEDANGNRSDFTYDGHDRLIKLNFPSTTVGAHSANSSDYEEYDYDPNGNMTSKRLKEPTAIRAEEGEKTPSTDPDDFDPVRSRPGKRNKEIGEVWEEDPLHKNHWEVYKDMKDYDNGVRDRSVWLDGVPKEKF